MLANGGGLLSQLFRLRQHGQRQPPDRPRDDLPLPAALGAATITSTASASTWLRSSAATATASWCPIRRWSRRSPKIRCWPTRRSLPKPGTRPGPTRWARSANLRWAEWNGRYRDDVRRFWRGDSASPGGPGHATGRLERLVRSRAGASRTTASTSSPRTTASRSTTW